MADIYVLNLIYIHNYILEWSIARVIVGLWLELRLVNFFDALVEKAAF